ncbi:GTP-binding protein [Spraguea lophii 42_110]|uniref:GTP-binding protein n=1 Tax=Spraguea lophii (strain 42_110) TaxID=1358809 RepID=S7XTR3_SPRLO|nr:GTP-binding protein [Spraguea lophii 42_110]
MRSKYKVVFLGNQSVGKTTLISQYVHSEVDDKYNPTIGIDFLTTTIDINGKQCRLQLWDTAGQERFNSIIPNYTRDSFAVVIVFDMSMEDTFNKIDHWIKNLVRIHDPNNNVKVVIVGNKMDLVSEQKRNEIRAKAEIKAKEHCAEYVEACAMKHETIKDLVSVLNKFISEDIQINENMEDIGEEEVNITEEKQTGCCSF